MVVYNSKSGLEKASLIENYYGFENGITGKDLFNNGIKQAKRVGVEVKKEEAIKIELIPERIKLKTDKGEYVGKALILATGSERNKPKIKGIEKFEGKGVSYCAICDGFFYRGKDVVVVGNGNYAISETNDLINIAKDITILTDGNKAPEFRAKNVSTKTEKIKEVRGNDKVEEIEFEDGSKLKTDGVFIAQGEASSLDFAKKLGILKNKNKIVEKEKMETNIKGIYACGDCIGGLLQVSKAVADGAIAGLQVINYIKANN